MRYSEVSMRGALALFMGASLALSGAAWAGAGKKGHSHGKKEHAHGKKAQGHAAGMKNHKGMKAAMKHSHGAGNGHSHAGETAYGMPGDPKKPSRVVTIVMKDADGHMSFDPSVIQVAKGEQIRFKVKNVGELDHEIVIATLADNIKHGKAMQKHPGMEHADPNAVRLEPGASGEMLWRFTKSGKFDMSCLIPGHRESGMTGSVFVEPAAVKLNKVVTKRKAGKTVID